MLTCYNLILLYQHQHLKPYLYPLLNNYYDETETPILVTQTREFHIKPNSN